MHLCRLHEDGERGGGRGGEGVPIQREGLGSGGAGCQGGLQGGKGSPAASPRPLSFGAELAQQFRAVPAELVPLLLHLFLLQILPGFAAITGNTVTKWGGHTGKNTLKGASLINWDACV